MRKAYIQLHLSIFLWGFTGIFGRGIDLSEGVLVWYRLFITVIILLMMAWWNKNFQIVRGPKLMRLSYIGFIVALHWLFFYGAIKYSNASIGLSCLSTISVFTCLLDPLINKKKIHFGEMALALMSAFGMLLIFKVQEIQRTGIILGLLAAFLSSYFTILNKKLSAELPSETITLYELGSGLLWLTLLMPIYLWLFPASQLLPSGKDWILLPVFCIFCTVIPFNLSLKALQKLSAYTSNLSINLEPVYGILLAFIFFHEQTELKTGFFIGTAIILLAVVLFMIMKHRSEIKLMMKRN